MARIKTPSYIKEPGGRMGDLVFYSFRGKIYTRMYVKPVNPDTEKQKGVRRTFGNAVKAWQNLAPEEKIRYNRKGDRLSLSGYNLYISQFMKMNLPYTDVKIDNQSIPVLSAPLPEPLQGSSVASPLSIKERSYTHYLQDIPGRDIS